MRSLVQALAVAALVTTSACSSADRAAPVETRGPPSLVDRAALADLSHADLDRLRVHARRERARTGATHVLVARLDVSFPHALLLFQLTATADGGELVMIEALYEPVQYDLREQPVVRGLTLDEPTARRLVDAFEDGADLTVQPRRVCPRLTWAQGLVGPAGEAWRDGSDTALPRVVERWLAEVRSIVRAATTGERSSVRGWVDRT